MAWLVGSGAVGLSGLDGVSGLADRERHDYMDKKCDAYFLALHSIAFPLLQNPLHLCSNAVSYQITCTTGVHCEAGSPAEALVRLLRSQPSVLDLLRKRGGEDLH